MLRKRTKSRRHRRRTRRHRRRQRYAHMQRLRRHHVTHLRRSGRRERHHRHTIAALTNAVRLQQMIEQVLPGFEMFTAYRTRFPLRRRRVHVRHVLLQVADAAVHATALFAYRFRLHHTSVTTATANAASWNPTTARSLKLSRTIFFADFL